MKTKVLLLFIFALIFSMYQEVPAQKKRAKTTKTQTVEVKAVPPEINFAVSMPKPWTHLLEVEMKIDWVQMPDKTDLKMPVWTPGSYLVREYARHVQDFAVKDANGNALNWQKTSKNTWTVETGGVKSFTASYKVYSNELTVRTNELNDEHAFFTPAALLFFVKDQLRTPSTVKVTPYKNWKVATGLPKVAGQENVFRAANFDVLYDSPFEVSDYKEVNFTVQGKPHRYVFSGEGNYDMNKIAADTTKIIEECYKIFGDLPYEDYTFIVNLRGGGGLEHLNSTALQWNRFGFKPQSRHNDFLGLVAHEYFHLWNVKRIRPDTLGPFDYENENYTKLLWVAEGATSYYESVLLRRAGIIGDKEMLSGKAGMFQQLQNRPGRFETSLEDASFDAWIKYYRPDENAVNNQISYYDKGDIVNMMLDLTIRSSSNGTKSLDDVFRYLYDEFFKKGKNYTPADFQKIAEMMAGKGLDDFFAKYVRGTEEIDYDKMLEPFGLRLAVDESGANRAYIGADTAEQNGVLTIRSIPADTPAYEQGLNTGDQIVAIDGYRTTQQFLSNYLNEKRPNDKVRLTIFRFDKLREIEFTLGKNIRKSYGIVPVDEPTEMQKRLYQDYTKAALE